MSTGNPTSSSTDFSNSRFSWLSSAISIFQVFSVEARPITLVLLSVELSTSAASAIRAGIRTQKRDPLLSSLSTSIVPPMNSAYFLQMDNPSPVPRRSGTSPTCTNGSKISAWRTESIPIPVSSTSITMSQRFAPSAICSVGSVAHRMVIPPLSVNLIALLSRLSRIWRSFPSSAFT